MTEAGNPRPPPLPPATNTAGRIALGFGIAAVAAGLLAQAFSILLPHLLARASMPPSEAWKLFVPFQLAIALFALLALGFGAAGLGRQGPRLAAAAGTALGGAQLAQLVVGLVAPVLTAMAF